MEKTNLIHEYIDKSFLECLSPNINEGKFNGHSSGDKRLNNQPPTSYESVLTSEFFTRLAEKSRNVFWIRSPDYKKQLYVSPAYEVVWGRSCQSLYEYPEAWSDYLYPEDRDRLEKQLLERKPSVTPIARYDEWYRIIRPNGEIRWIKDTSFPIHDDIGNCIGFAGIAEDITEEKEHKQELIEAKEQAEAMSRAKTEFLANMSHDIKTPLAGIIGLSQLLAAGMTNPEERESLQEILESGRNLMSFFDNCLELSKLENADVILITERFNFKEVIEQVIALFRPAVHSKNLKLHVHYDEKIPACLLGSRAAIYRILQNLIGNAIKFTHEGFVAIRANLSKKLSDKQVIVEFSVKDSGIGIPYQKQKLIFEKLTRLTPSHQGIYEGGGIGLYLVDKFVKAMSGEIYIKSEEKQGSNFIVVLPLQIPLLDKDINEQLGQKLFGNSNASPDVVQPITTFTEKPKILLVEDNKVAQKMAKKLLESIGCAVDTADNGMAAIKLFAQHKYELVYMDVGLPDMNGFETTKLLHEKSGSHSQPVPVIALTAHAGLNEKKACFDAGMVGLLNKPLSPDQAIQSINKFVYQKDVNVEGLMTQDYTEKSKNISEKSIDLTEGARIINASEEDAKDVLAELVMSLPESRGEIVKSHQANNIELLAKVIHKLHGGVSYAGVPRLRAAVKNVEETLKKGEIDKFDHLYQRMLKEMDAVEQEFKAIYL